MSSGDDEKDNSYAIKIIYFILDRRDDLHDRPQE